MELIHRYLKTAHLEFETVDNGEECLNLITANPLKYDLILMDIHMPLMSGLEATEQIRRINPKIPIIALTAGVTQDEQDKCLACGMNALLIKPFDALSLATILNKYLK